MAKTLVLDATKCRGCFSCSMACASRNLGEGDINIARIRVSPFFDEAFYVPLACFQCETPYCARVCPASALSKNLETGVVELSEERCIGCKMCVLACPFGNMAFVHNYPSKCDLCEGDPACVKACQWDALKFVEVEEMPEAKLEATAQRVLETQREFLQPIEVTGERQGYVSLAKE